MGAPRGPALGAEFEDCLKKQARSQGLLARKMKLSCEYQGDKVFPTKSELDFQVIDPKTGRVAFVDAKTFAVARVMYSMLNPNQIELAELLNRARVPAGFVIWFRLVDRVTYFTGAQVALGGAGSSFGPEDGLHLGGLLTFDLSRLFP